MRLARLAALATLALALLAAPLAVKAQQAAKVARPHPNGSVPFSGVFQSVEDGRKSDFEGTTPYSREFRVKNQFCGLSCGPNSVFSGAGSPPGNTSTAKNPLSLCLTNSRPGERKCDSGTRDVNVFLQI